MIPPAAAGADAPEFVGVAGAAVGAVRIERQMDLIARLPGFGFDRFDLEGLIEQRIDDQLYQLTASATTAELRQLGLVTLALTRAVS